MATYSTRIVETSLEKKGFKRDKTHHFMFWFFYYNKKSSVRTRTSNDEREFDEKLLAERKKQMKLTKKQFIRFIECPLDGCEYAKILLEKGDVRL